MDCPAIGSADGEAIIYTSVSDRFRHSNVERLSRRPGRRSALLTGRMLAHDGKIRRPVGDDRPLTIAGLSRLGCGYRKVTTCGLVAAGYIGCTSVILDG